MSKLSIYKVLLILSSIVLSYCGIQPTKLGQAKDPLPNSSVSQQTDYQIIQDFLDDPTAYKSPIGSFKIDKSLIWKVNKSINWANTVLIPTDSIDVLIIRAKEFNCENLTIDAENLALVKPTKTMITLQYEGTIMQWFRFTNLRLLGNIKKIRTLNGYGYTGIKSDGETPTGNSTGSNNKGELHRGIFDMTVTGLHTGLHLKKSSKPNSNHDIFIQGRVCKKLAILDKVGANKIRFWYNNNHCLMEQEKEYDLFELKSDKNIVEYRIADYRKGDKPQNLKSHKRYAHKYGISNYGKFNVLKKHYLHGGNDRVKEIVKFAKKISN